MEGKLVDKAQQMMNKEAGRMMQGTVGRGEETMSEIEHRGNDTVLLTDAQ